MRFLILFAAQQPGELAAGDIKGFTIQAFHDMVTVWGDSALAC